MIRNRGYLSAIILLAIATLLMHPQAARANRKVQPRVDILKDRSGRLAVYQLDGPTRKNTPFFQPLGTNGRACVTCHRPRDGWTITPAHIRRRYRRSHGSGPLFRLIDGATCPDDDVSTSRAAKEAYGLLLSKGLIRIERPVPADAEFTVVGITDPYHCSTAATLSVYRRPLPVTNLPFLSSIMWDGRETDLSSQAIDATLIHEQADSAPTDDQLRQIVDFTQALFTAQWRDRKARALDARGALGGPFELARQEFFIGINDPFGNNPTGAPFDENVFTLYQSWTDMRGRAKARARAAIARGERIFNTKPIMISGVAGLNDVLGKDPIVGTCSTCHDTPGVGNSSAPAFFDIGVADASQSTPDLPLFMLRCDGGSVIFTSDPGRALVTGKCADIGKFKVPILRGLAARAPYFHNGSAATLTDVVNFYRDRFAIPFTDEEVRDLVAFLKSL